MLWELFCQPFAEFDFMWQALLGMSCLALGAAPLGVLLQLRRMSLTGDAISHAVLPGVAAGYLIAGQNIWAMGAGGLAAGLVMALGVGVVSRKSVVREDAHLAAFYLTCLALGVALVSRYGSQADLLHLLFGSVLAMDASALLLLAVVAGVTVLALFIARWALLAQVIDPLFLQTRGGRSTLWHVVFLMLVVFNLVAGFQAMGTLMAVGLMMLPSIIARLWVRSIRAMVLLALLLALVCGYGGLLLSYHAELPPGPAIILLCAAAYVFSLVFGAQAGWRRWLNLRQAG
ncbi:MAG: metal ABC transporter permease [Brachymonas sp.]|jgi:zinc/manganese transport system permease protein|nr:metal ABC transporter permease [Brachymonas sp.]